MKKLEIHRLARAETVGNLQKPRNSVVKPTKNPRNTGNKAFEE
jgi:hypothetical protein